MFTISFNPAVLETFLLLSFRISGVFLAAPLIGSGRVPMRLRAALALTITFILLPVAGPTIPTSHYLETAWAGARELFLGFAIGFIANLVFAAVQMAGEMADTQSAFGLAGVVSPQTGEFHSVIGQLQLAVTWLIFLLANGHHFALEGLAASLRVIPLGGPISLEPTPIIAAVSATLSAAVRLAAPIVAALIIADFSLGLLTRAAPQMNLFAIGFPIKLALGILMALLCSPMLAAAQRELFALVNSALQALLAPAG